MDALHSIFLFPSPFSRCPARRRCAEHPPRGDHWGAAEGKRPHAPLPRALLDPTQPSQLSLPGQASEGSGGGGAAGGGSDSSDSEDDLPLVQLLSSRRRGGSVGAGAGTLVQTEPGLAPGCQRSPPATTAPAPAAAAAAGPAEAQAAAGPAALSAQPSQGPSLDAFLGSEHDVSIGGTPLPAFVPLAAGGSAPAAGPPAAAASPAAAAAATSPGGGDGASAPAGAEQTPAGGSVAPAGGGAAAASGTPKRNTPIIIPDRCGGIGSGLGASALERSSACAPLCCTAAEPARRSLAKCLPPHVCLCSEDEDWPHYDV